jgi:hypothetical protein
MRKALLCLLVIAGLATTTAAQAQHSLLPGDVLELGKVSFETRYDYTRFTSDANTVGTSTGSYTQNSGIGSIQFAAGLGNGIGISAALPYTFFENTKVESVPVFDQHRDGVGDITVGAKLQLLNTQTVNLTTGLTVKLNSAGGDAGSGTTEFNPSIALTLNRQSNVAPFIVYSPTFVKGTRNPDSHSGVVGVNLVAGQSAFILLGQARFNNEGAYKRNEEYKVSLEPVIALNSVINLTPTIGYIHRTPAESATTGPARSTEKGLIAGMGIYLKF